MHGIPDPMIGVWLLGAAVLLAAAALGLAARAAWRWLRRRREART